MFLFSSVRLTSRTCPYKSNLNQCHTLMLCEVHSEKIQNRTATIHVNAHAGYSPGVEPIMCSNSFKLAKIGGLTARPTPRPTLPSSRTLLF